MAKQPIEKSTQEQEKSTYHEFIKTIRTNRWYALGTAVVGLYFPIGTVAALTIAVGTVVKTRRDVRAHNSKINGTANVTGRELFAEFMVKVKDNPLKSLGVAALALIFPIGTTIFAMLVTGTVAKVDHDLEKKKRSEATGKGNQKPVQATTNSPQVTEEHSRNPSKEPSLGQRLFGENRSHNNFKEEVDKINAAMPPRTTLDDKGNPRLPRTAKPASKSTQHRP